jgi:hypothetical protein
MMSTMRHLLPILVGVTTACTRAAEPMIASPPLDVGVAGVAVMKARHTGTEYLLLLESLTSLRELDGPHRVLRRFRLDGAVLEYAAPAGTEISDFAAHPDGDVSILVVTEAGYALERWLPDGSRSGAVPIASVAPTQFSHDAGRVAAAGKDVVLALRARDNSVHGYRYTPDGTSYRAVWEAVVEPANDLLPVGLTSGSFDTFGQLENRFRSYVDVTPDGAIWVGILLDPVSGLLDAHNAAFGDDLRPISDTSPTYDVLVTRLAGSGDRVFSRVVGTPWHDEIYAIRAVAQELLIVGRSETTPGAAGGWDALLARVSDAGVVSVHTIDVDAADILFDVDALPDGRLIAVGGTGYVQNPSGASISEGCSLLALVLTGDTPSRLGLPSLPRHNHLRTVLASEPMVWVGGMTNGPGTHSGDGDPSLIRADPFVAALTLP